ncbi:HAD family phosphatase [Alicyclobacillus sp. SO9]|uniref:HAD family hydrolase n=1 Tax=Alicyclobacillus sp. SO9 TaxID=2665646 RepID=UPI0018E74BAC|nr:HAD family phosphatase [Alicyclobacillus sp. SO9]QQE78207.1 HAD family phosphatase [Alicyclobacillus sp. SO9]
MNSGLNIKLLLFDIGDVFLHRDLGQLHEEARQFGLSGSELHEVIYGPRWDRYKRGQLTEAELLLEIAGQLPSSLENRVVELLESSEKSVVLNESLVTLVGQLQPSYRVAALSNAGANLEARLEHFNIARLFELVVNSHWVRMAKPDEEIYRYTAEHLHLQPNEILFIDDKLRNTSVAEKLGFHTHVFTTTDTFMDFLRQEGLFTLTQSKLKKNTTLSS